MPEAERVQDFVTLIESGRTIERCGNSTQTTPAKQENSQEPRRGLATLIAHEERMLAAFEELRFSVKTVLIDGDQVALRYVFSGMQGGRSICQDEIALQRWNGERIVEERFFYSPARPQSPRKTERRLRQPSEDAAS